MLKRVEKGDDYAIFYLVPETDKEFELARSIDLDFDGDFYIRKRGEKAMQLFRYMCNLAQKKKEGVKT